MTPREWDRHEKMLCERCDYDKHGRNACPVKAIMRTNPKDEQLRPLFKSGNCSQFKEKTKPTRRGRGIRNV